MPEIKLTDDQLTALYEAQKAHLIETLQTNRNGDDGGDYITSALDVFQILQTSSCDQSDTEAIEFWLNTPLIDMATEIGYRYYKFVQLGHCASDGICQAIYDLHPIALED